MIRRTERVARKPRYCSSFGCRRRIEVGEQYVEIVHSPFHEGVLAGAWERISECFVCGDARVAAWSA
jgi:hypothetical protein